MNLKSVSPFILALLLFCSVSIAGCIGIASAPSHGASTSLPDAHSVTLSWVPSASDVTAYNVYRAESATGPFLRLATVVAADHEYIDENVEDSEAYYYVLTSVSSDGMESADSTLAVARVP